MSDNAKGLSAEDAERLVRSGDDLLDGGRDHNRGRKALIDEIQAIVERVTNEFKITHLDVVGALEFVKFDVLNDARCEGCDEEGEEWIQ